MLIPVRSRQFKRDVRKAEKRGKNMNKLRTLLSLLIEEKPLPRHYCDHPLKGDWVGYHDIHIKPDWLLIYRIEVDKLHLIRTGTHSDLFKE
ncbi:MULTISPECIES: type II toxin-antitoxin system YafQ family toxin [unclassified Bartonella]|uniref:type II toxin-antitoxin system YafQ family toxin n=1 Tax=unclassified Bartonella TaxID=2645622 RepID=UPI0035D118BA